MMVLTDACPRRWCAISKGTLATSACVSGCTMGRVSFHSPERSPGSCLPSISTSLPLVTLQPSLSKPMWAPRGTEMPHGQQSVLHGWHQMHPAECQLPPFAVTITVPIPFTSRSSPLPTFT